MKGIRHFRCRKIPENIGNFFRILHTPIIYIHWISAYKYKQSVFSAVQKKRTSWGMLCFSWGRCRISHLEKGRLMEAGWIRDIAWISVRTWAWLYVYLFPNTSVTPHSHKKTSSVSKAFSKRGCKCCKSDAISNWNYLVWTQQQLYQKSTLVRITLKVIWLPITLVSISFPPELIACRVLTIFWLQFLGTAFRIEPYYYIITVVNFIHIRKAAF